MTSAGEDVEKREHWCTIDGNVNWYSICAKQYEGSSKKLKIKLLSDPAISLLGIYSKEMKSLSQGYLPSHVHWSIIHNSQDVEKPKCPSVDERIMKNIRTCNIMDRPWGQCAKWNSQKRKMLHGIIYMWNLKEKNVKLIEKRVEK